LRQAFEYIKRDSLQNAEKVRNAISLSAGEIGRNPEIHPPDKYKQANDGNYRAYELYNYRISYHVGKEMITIIRVRHTSMNPLSY
jgi:plasmid stabilization system protein ParE